jgi:hypothetical protein
MACNIAALKRAVGGPINNLSCKSTATQSPSSSTLQGTFTSSRRQAGSLLIDTTGTSTEASRAVAGPYNPPPFMSAWEAENLDAWAKPAQLNAIGTRMTVRDRCNARIKAYSRSQEAEPVLSPSDFVGVEQLPESPVESSDAAAGATRPSSPNVASSTTPPPSPPKVSRWSPDSSLNGELPHATAPGRFGRIASVIKRPGRLSSQTNTAETPPSGIYLDDAAAAAKCPVSRRSNNVATVPIEVAQSDVDKYGRSGACVAGAGASSPRATSAQKPFIRQRRNALTPADIPFMITPAKLKRSNALHRAKRVATFMLTKGDVPLHLSRPSSSFAVPPAQLERVVVGDPDHSTIFGDFILAGTFGGSGASSSSVAIENDTVPAVAMPEALAIEEDDIAVSIPTVSDATVRSFTRCHKPRVIHISAPVSAGRFARERAESCVASLHDGTSEIESSSVCLEDESENAWSGAWDAAAEQVHAALQRWTQEQSTKETETAIMIDVHLQDGDAVWLATERAGANTARSFRRRVTARLLH